MTVKRRPEARFAVVHKHVVFRSAPALEAEMLYVAKKGHTIMGVPHSMGSGLWVRLSEASLKECCIQGQAWALMHGHDAITGDLLRPVHEEVECLEELLWRLSEERGDRVRPLVGALHAAGLGSGSAFLAAVDSKPGAGALQQMLAEQNGQVLPDRLVNCLKMAVEDSRLTLQGFPQSLAQTKVRILFTAPHSIPLCREGHTTHQPEVFTERLASEFAQMVGGACLTWSQQEERRAHDHYKLHKAPDPTNKDPNFTHRDALCDSPWTRNLNEVRYLFGPGRPCLHVDLHGCKDPSAVGGSHLVVGLRAMEFAGRHGMEDFRIALHKVFAAALRGVAINVRPQRQLTGALEDDRCTLTQQSLREAGGAWTCAVQLEMSRTLRRQLMVDKELRTLMAQAVAFAWALVSRDADPAQTAQALQYWLARCKAFYAKRSGETLFGSAIEALRPQEQQSSGRTLVALASAEDGGRPADDEDREEAVTGEATANSEALAPPYQGPLNKLEGELVAQARGIQKLPELPSSPTSDELRPTPVESLTNWLRLTSDTLFPLRPEPRYFVAGSWADFEPKEMIWTGRYFAHCMTVGPSGYATFQLLLDKDWKRTVYPSVKNANPYDNHTLCGPNKKGHGKNWCIGVRKTEPSRYAAKSGDRFRIYLLVDGGAAAQQVVWEFLGVRGSTSAYRPLALPRQALVEAPAPCGSPSSVSTEAIAISTPSGSPSSVSTEAVEISEESAATSPPPEMQVVVHIDRSLAMQITLSVTLGTDVAALKDEIARLDPTGRTNPQGFSLRFGEGLLADEVVLTDHHTELEVCPHST